LVAVIVLGDSVGKAEIARWSIVSAGVWWAAFTTLPLLSLRNRPADAGEHHGSPLLDGFKQLGHTLRGLKAYPLTLFFLIAFLIYNDGIQTVIVQSSQYGTKELLLKQETLVFTILIVQFVAVLGALGMGYLAKRVGAWKTILLSLVLWTVVIIAAF